MGFWSRELGSERIDEIVGTVREHADNGDADAAWKTAQPLMKVRPVGRLPPAGQPGSELKADYRRWPNLLAPSSWLRGNEAS